jgi:hypothetical protein
MIQAYSSYLKNHAKSRFDKLKINVMAGPIRFFLKGSKRCLARCDGGVISKQDGQGKCRMENPYNNDRCGRKSPWNQGGYKENNTNSA